MVRWSVALCLLLAMLAAGCSELPAERQGMGEPVTVSPPRTSEPVLADPTTIQGEITVWGWAPWDAAFAAVLPAFQERYPHVRVNVEMMSQEETYLRLLASLATGSGAPDVVGVSPAHLDGLMMQAGLADLLGAPFYADRYGEHFLPHAWQRATSPDGRLMALPWDAGPGLLYYRRDLFEQAGLPSDPEEVAALLATWDQFVATGQKLAESGVAVVAHPLEIFQIPFHHTGVFDGDWNVIVHRGQGARYLEIAQRIREADLDANLVPLSVEWAEALGAGKIATVYGGPSMANLLKTWIDKGGTGRWGAIPVPEDPSQHWGGSFLAIPDQAANKTAAWAFVEFALASVPGQNSMMRAAHLFPAFRPAYADPLYDEPDPYFGGQPIGRLLADIAVSVNDPVATPMDGAAERALLAVVSTCIEEQTAPADCLLAAKQRIESVVSRDRKVALLMRQQQRNSVVPARIPPSDY